MNRKFFLKTGAILGGAALLPSNSLLAASLDYLKYKNKRGDFVDALFNILNWDNVAEPYEMAKKLK